MRYERKNEMRREMEREKEKENRTWGLMSSVLQISFKSNYSYT